ncbi:MAG: hypothetical protein IKC03_03180 [Oscillospiraceae bacterium]|nr:hypothetical protein [Oscillospiraceae bacterium]
MILRWMKKKRMIFFPFTWIMSFLILLPSYNILENRDYDSQLGSLEHWNIFEDCLQCPVAAAEELVELDCSHRLVRLRRDRTACPRCPALSASELVQTDCSLCASRFDKTPVAADILASSRVISHGMGAVGTVTTLNCLEGFQAQYAKGVRVFEVDLRMTHDLQVVLRHDWRAGWQEGVSETAVPTLREFLSKPLLEDYTPLSFRDLLKLMEQYPDICIVTDTKFTDAEVVTLQFEAMLRDARELGLTYLFDRMVIQVYSPLMFKIVDHLHHFPNYIYTLYSIGFGQTEAAFEEISVFCIENGIAGVTMWDSWWREAYAPIAQEYGISVYTHTVNNADAARTMLAQGVSGVYTDRLLPEELLAEEEIEEMETEETEHTVFEEA